MAKKMNGIVSERNISNLLREGNTAETSREKAEVFANNFANISSNSNFSPAILQRKIDLNEAFSFAELRRAIRATATASESTTQAATTASADAEMETATESTATEPTAAAAPAELPAASATVNTATATARRQTLEDLRWTSMASGNRPLRKDDSDAQIKDRR